jgi:hypothetical protein
MNVEREMSHEAVASGRINLLWYPSKKLVNIQAQRLWECEYGVEPREKAPKDIENPQARFKITPRRKSWSVWQNAAILSKVGKVVVRLRRNNINEGYRCVGTRTLSGAPESLIAPAGVQCCRDENSIAWKC